MKTKAFFIAITTLFLISITASAQPYTLDEKIKPVLLELRDNPEGEGAMGIIANATIKDKSQYYYVKGQDMFQFIDVFIFSNFGDPDFKANLVSVSWKDIADTQTTADSEKGVIHFKLRSQGDFGIEVFPTTEAVNYSIVINASEPSKEFLGSAFKKITKKDMSESEEFIPNEATNDSGSSNTNYFLYAIIGIALLVIGFLASKVMSKNKAGIIILLLSLGMSSQSYAQGTIKPPEERTFDLDDIIGRAYENWLAEHGGELLGDISKSIDDLDRKMDRLEFVGQRLRELNPYKKIKAIKEFYDSYKDISSCIEAARPPGMPRIPSFCDTDDCETCFLGARLEFEEVRYKFVKLQAIYKCTMNFINRGIALGDSYAPVHGVTGIVWQNEKFKLLKSVKGLKKSYDSKRLELLGRMQRALIELDACEAKHGIPDWYDRFGYMYYDFTKTQYQRND